MTRYGLNDVRRLFGGKGDWCCGPLEQEVSHFVEEISAGGRFLLRPSAANLTRDMTVLLFLLTSLIRDFPVVVASIAAVHYRYTRRLLLLSIIQVVPSIHRLLLLFRRRVSLVRLSGIAGGCSASLVQLPIDLLGDVPKVEHA